MKLEKDGFEIFIQYYWFDKFNKGFNSMTIINGILMMISAGRSCHKLIIQLMRGARGFFNIGPMFFISAIPFFSLHLFRLAGLIYHQNMGTIPDGCISYNSELQTLTKSPFGNGCFVFIGKFSRWQLYFSYIWPFTMLRTLSDVQLWYFFSVYVFFKNINMFQKIRNWK